jgi:hypothetical protein
MLLKRSKEFMLSDFCAEWGFVHTLLAMAMIY